MKVIIAGSRSIGNDAMVRLQDAIKCSGFEITEVVSGTCRGVDKLGELWAIRHGIPIRQFPADWSQYGKAAGMERNIEMARYADALIALWDGKSRGTSHMIRSMLLRKKPFYIG